VEERRDHGRHRPGPGHRPGGDTSLPFNLTNVNGTLFFKADDGTHGRELWKSDGTTAGTVLVKDINPGGADSYPSDLTNVNGTLFFTADDSTHGRELWKSDGTTAGTVLVKAIRPGVSSSPSDLTNVNGTLFFTADDGTHGRELWKSDGTTAGTVLVSSLAMSPSDLTNVNGTLFFMADDGTHGSELWKSDGTAAGTVLVKDIRPGGDSSYRSDLTNVNGTLFFAAYDSTPGSELWMSDGTAASTTLVADINPGGASSDPSDLANVNGALFFSADDGTHGRELWTLVEDLPALTLGDAGFESPALASGTFVYDPAGTPWTFAGGAGVAGNGSGFTAGNPAAPEGTQVAFLQGTGSFSQTVANLGAGTYRLTFQAAQRGNFQASRQDFRVLVDGQAVGTFTPAGTAYAGFTAAAFTVGAGAHTISFAGLDSAGGDNTAFVDNVQLAAAVTTPTFGDAGFESPAVGSGTFGAFQVAPAGTPWAFAGSAGISGNGSGFTAGNPNAPEGAQVAFLQGNGSFSQTVTGMAAGTYQLSFQAAQRGNFQASRQDFRVLVDGVSVGTFTPGGTAYSAFTTAAFVVGSGAHTVTFQGLDTAGGDNTAFLDNVQLAAAPALGDAGFESPTVGAGTFGAFQVAPAGTPWAFAGSAGISGNGSGFTAGNPNAPEGSQVAFLQGVGSFSQTVTGMAAGTYRLTFQAAQRGNFNQGGQDFRVLVDGAVVGTFRPGSAAYAGLTTAAFAVGAGAHTISFVGLDSTGGDNTAFLDDVRLATASALGDAGFESPGVGAGTFGAFQVAPAGTPWAFAGGAGISGNGSGFTSGNPNAPEGAQVAFLQGNGSFSQSLDLAAGTYRLSFQAAQRGNFNQGGQDFRVLVDGAVVGTFRPAGASYQAYAIAAFAVAAGSHTITFQGLDSAGGDNTAFVDDVRLTQ
jgi:ELWxxDGT repeat protein